LLLASLRYCLTYSALPCISVTWYLNIGFERFMFDYLACGLGYFHLDTIRSLFL
jgi:hypothetical protein